MYYYIICIIYIHYIYYIKLNHFIILETTQYFISAIIQFNKKREYMNL